MAASVSPTPIIKFIIDCSLGALVRTKVCALTFVIPVSIIFLGVKRQSHLNPLSYPWSHGGICQQTDCRKYEQEHNSFILSRVSLEAGRKHIFLFCPFTYSQLLLHTKLTIAVIASSGFDHPTILRLVFRARLSRFVTGKLNESTVRETCAFAKGGRR